MKDGIICINKPEGMTSNDVIYKLRSLLGIRKLGHTGTLDPLATGVLPVCINKGTRVCEYMDADFKTYRAVMVLGVVTDTDDATGEVIERREVNVSESGIKEALGSMLGLIDQLPPMYSAVRINGRKLYDYMHSGSETEISQAKEKLRERSRQVFIKSITVEKTELPRVTFSVECSKGTYIRSICRDAGEYLGCGAMMEKLERTASGVFKVEDAVTIEELRSTARENGLLNEEGFPIDKTFREDIPQCFEKYIVPCDYPLTIFGSVEVDEENAERFLNGWHLSYRDVKIISRPLYAPPKDENGRDIDISDIRAANPDSPQFNHGSYPGLKIHPEYAKAYKVYRNGNDGGEPVFLGVAFHSDKYHKLVADKVIYRQQ